MSAPDQVETAPEPVRQGHLMMPENHLDVVVTPGSTDPTRRASPGTALVAVVVMPLFFLVTFTLCYLSATHAPAPHHMNVTIAGPADVTEEIANTLDSRARNAFDITQTSDDDATRRDVQQRNATGALIIRGNDVTAVIASGGGRLAASSVQALGQQVAAELGGTVIVDDVSPLPVDDPGGSVLFYFLVVCTVGGFLSITAISQVLPKVSVRAMVLTAVGSAVLVPILGFSVISVFVNFDVTFGTAMSVVGVGMIYTLTVGLLSTVFVGLAGQGAIFLQIALLVGLNLPSAGGSAPGSMLPAFWQLIHATWFGAGALEAMRSFLFFQGNGVGSRILQLLIWTVVALALVLVVMTVKRRRAAPPRAHALGDQSTAATHSPDPIERSQTV